MQIGTKEDRFFIIQIDLFQSEGCQEADELINLLMRAGLVDQGKEHLEQCLHFVRMLHAARQHSN